jgi:Helix-hairpin-helix motif.
LRARSRWKAALQQQGVSQSDINTVIRRYGHGPHGWLGPNTNGNPSEEGLMKLPGIGKVTANKIMAVGRLGWMDKD